jgi:hypothetical protein
MRFDPILLAAAAAMALAGAADAKAGAVHHPHDRKSASYASFAAGKSAKEDSLAGYVDPGAAGGDLTGLGGKTGHRNGQSLAGSSGPSATLALPALGGDGSRGHGHGGGSRHSGGGGRHSHHRSH